MELGLGLGGGRGRGGGGGLEQVSRGRRGAMFV